MSRGLSSKPRMYTESMFSDGEYSGSNVCPSSNEIHYCGKGQVETSFSTVLSMTPRSTTSPGLVWISCNNVGEVGEVGKCCSETL